MRATPRDRQVAGRGQGPIVERPARADYEAF